MLGPLKLGTLLGGPTRGSKISLAFGPVANRNGLVLKSAVPSPHVPGLVVWALSKKIHYSQPITTTQHHRINNPQPQPTMPSRNNPNLPSSLNRRVLSHRRIAVRTKTRARTTTTTKNTRSAPTESIPKSFAGVVRGKTVSSKKVKKVARNKNYALERKKEQQAVELLKTKGEVEMMGMFPTVKAWNMG